ncbi:MAG TPA: class D sortase [Bryobacteraceae bacterium]|nr:class D sortase [Bryobacteraceae bacterium]
MRVRVDQGAVTRLVKWTQRMLVALAVSALGYCGFVLVDGWTFQNRESRRLEQLLNARKLETSSAATPAVFPVSTKIPAQIAEGGLIGRITIPRLAMSLMVMEGTNGSVLRRAVGHIAGTALPGQPGNVGIAAHRDTLFRPLRNIRENDLVSLTTPAGEYRYRVVSTAVVSPTDVGVLEPGANQNLILVTCYPFNFIGSAPRRFIVRAERIP